jgi:hypothetical protein
VEVRQERVDDPELRAGDEEEARLERSGRDDPAVLRAAASSVRTLVVPTATTRRPSSFARRIATEVSSGMTPRSGSIRCSSTLPPSPA